MSEMVNSRKKVAAETSPTGVGDDTNECLFSESNFFISLQAGQATAISTHHLAYASDEMSPEDIMYIVIKQLEPGQGQLILVNQPEKEMVQKFTQADVDSMRLVYIPPEPVTVDEDRTLSFWLTVIRKRDNTVLVPKQEFKIQGEKINISEKYFEILGVNNNHPDLRFVITEMVSHGSLTLLCTGKKPVSLEGGTEFRFLHKVEGVVQYEHDDTDQITQDSFEILATDGTFEAMNRINLNIIIGEITPHLRTKVAGNTDQESIFYFGTDHKVIIAEENSGILRIPVLRRGDLKSEAEVQCYTMQISATAGLDYISRPLNATRSVLVFTPGQSTKDCELRILDDSLYEGEEQLELRLINFRGFMQGNLGLNRALNIKIIDFEDRPRVEFERGEVTLSETMNMKYNRATSTISINVVRRGDISHEARVRISTCDDTASAGVDYEPISQLLVFGPSSVSLPVRVTIIHRSGSGQHKSFSLLLSSKEISGVELGDINSMTIVISYTGSGNIVKVLPYKPVVISLSDSGRGIETSSKPSANPGYPLLCINACDPKHPQFIITDPLCQNAGINSTNIAYSWEVAPSNPTARGQDIFRPLTSSTVFSETHDKVLDSMYFSNGFRMRCITTAYSQLEDGKRILGLPIKSEPITVSSDNGVICPKFGGEMASGEGFSAVLTYINPATQDERRNMIHVHLEIPHADGMIPLISTLPLTNPGLLIFDKIRTLQHKCSNLHIDGAFLMNDEYDIKDTGFSRPYQMSVSMRGNITVLQYRHLNLRTCKWAFDAWFHMTNLVDDCGGKIITSSQMEEKKSYVTVQVPLYITSMYPSAPLSWTAVEHKTNLQVSISYASMLQQEVLNTQQNLDAMLQVTRVTADENGCLIVDFVTSALFRGYFVTSHYLLPGMRSEILPPAGVNTNFSLSLIWSQHTWDGPQQSWRARSVFGVQDYSGEYIVKLLPCTAESSQTYQEDNVNCLPRGTLMLKMPVIFRHSSHPAALTYNLNTHFTITNNPSVLLTSPAQINQIPDYIEFAPGDAVYGIVLWQESQHLYSAYTLIIDYVHLCAAEDGFSSTLDLSNLEYMGKSHYGCLVASSLKHSFLLLDRKNPSYTDVSFNGVKLEAHFASDLPEFQLLESYPGVDGFVFKVDPLYEINSGYTWYLQVKYTIGASSAHRVKRSTTAVAQNGTRIARLHLRQKAIQHHKLWLIIALGGPAAVISLVLLSMHCRNAEKSVSESAGNVPLNSDILSIQSAKYRTTTTITVWNDIKGEGTPV